MLRATASRRCVIACVLLSLGACDDETSHERGAAAESAPATSASTAEASASRSTDPLARDRGATVEPRDAHGDEDRSSEALGLRLVPRPDAFFVVASCLDARGETEADARRACRELARRGTPFQRRWCTCEADQIVALRPDDPIAFFRGCCWAVGETPEAARAACEERHRAGWCEAEDVDAVHVVTGPHARRGPFRPFEGLDHRYLVPSALDDWFDASGEPPCFAAGTLVATEHGERAIETIRVGDRVLAREGEELVLAPVRGVKTRRASVVWVVELQGRTLRITPEHPVWLEGAWRPAREIERGDALTTPEGVVRVEEVREERVERDVFTLRVGPPHSFFADGVWVHNY